MNNTDFKIGDLYLEVFGLTPEWLPDTHEISKIERTYEREYTDFQTT